MQKTASQASSKSDKLQLQQQQPTAAGGQRQWEKFVEDRLGELRADIERLVSQTAERIREDLSGADAAREAELERLSRSNARLASELAKKDALLNHEKSVSKHLAQQVRILRDCTNHEEEEEDEAAAGDRRRKRELADSSANVASADSLALLQRERRKRRRTQEAAADSASDDSDNTIVSLESNVCDRLDLRLSPPSRLLLPGNRAPPVSHRDLNATAQPPDSSDAASVGAGASVKVSADACVPTRSAADTVTAVAEAAAAVSSCQSVDFQQLEATTVDGNFADDTFVGQRRLLLPLLLQFLLSLDQRKAAILSKFWIISLPFFAAKICFHFRENFYSASQHRQLPCEDPSTSTSTSTSSNSNSTSSMLKSMFKRSKANANAATDPDDTDPVVLKKKVELKKNKNVERDYTIEEVIGSGRFGQVHRCVEKSTSKQFAAKYVTAMNEDDRQSVANEIAIMKRLKHPRLMQLYDAYFFRDTFVLVMELITGGELFDRVIDESFDLTESKCERFMREICEGMEYIHSQNVVHLDLKPENILCLTRTGFRIKIIDFGLSRSKAEDLRVMFGTPEFVSPEVLAYEPVGPSSDMWSVGVICYVLLSGLSPFMGDSDAETYGNIAKVSFSFDFPEFDEISSDAKDFVLRLLQKDWKSRLTASQCLKHIWLKNPEHSSRHGHVCKRRLKSWVYRRKWHKAFFAIVALIRMGGSFD